MGVRKMGPTDLTATERHSPRSTWPARTDPDSGAKWDHKYNRYQIRQDMSRSQKASIVVPVVGPPRCMQNLDGKLRRTEPIRPRDGYGGRGVLALSSLGLFQRQTNVPRSEAERWSTTP